MTRKLPKSKSVATLTARSCDAVAADLKNVVAGFEKAAQLYREGRYEEANYVAECAAQFARTPLLYWMHL